MQGSVKNNSVWKNNKIYVHLAIAVILFLMIELLLEPSGALTAKGVDVLAVFVPLAYLWLTADMVWPSIAATVLLIILGALDAEQAWYEFMGSSTIVLTIGCSMICAVLVETGVIRWIARYILSRKAISNNPNLFLFMYGLVTALVACLAGVFGSAMVMLALAKELREQVGYDKDSRFSQAMCMMIMWMAPIGDVVMPFGKAIPLLGLRMMKAQGIAVTAVDFVKVGWIYALLATLSGWLIVRFVLRPELEKLRTYDSDSIRKDLHENPLDRRQICSLVMITIYLVLQILPELGIPVLSEWLGNMGLGTLAMIPVLFGCLVRVDHAPVLDLTVILKKVNWRLVFFLGGMFLITGSFSDPEIGIMTWLASLLAPIADSISPAILVRIGFVIGVLVTNIASNALVVAVLDGAFYSVLIAGGASTGTLIAFGIIVVQAAMSAFATPSGSSSSAVVFGDGESGVTVSSCLKYNLIQMACMCLACCAIMMPICAVVFG